MTPAAPPARLFDETSCRLGEGPLWHPLRNQLVWFDIHGRRMLLRGHGETARTETRDFPEIVTAAGWVDEDTLVVASETALLRYDIPKGRSEILAPLEADRPETRSNDGRADRQGGFWIGTMRKDEARPDGAIYRYYRGELRRLHPGLSIPNAICFSPDGTLAYWADSRRKEIMRQRLDAEGWPADEPEVFVDLKPEGLVPDGAVIDASGHLWNAQWGAGRVAEYDTRGRFLRALALPALHATCPAFIGPGLSVLVCTSAQGGFAEAPGGPGPHGQTFRFDGLGPGLTEPRVVL